MMTDLVECHSGFEYAEKPIALCWEGQRLEIVVIEGRWRIQEGKRFLVRTEDGQIFELIYRIHDDVWHINQP